MKETQEIKLILDQVLAYIHEQQFPVPGQSVQVAVSGGMDSMVLLDLLLSLGYTAEVLHVNYGLRGKESERDELFVTEFCQKRGLSFHVLKPTSESLKGNIQQKAREIRYEWFRSRSELYTATGHHKQDQAETMLMRMLKGAGPEGISGIRPLQNRIFRPLLCLDRAEVDRYALHRQLEFVEDSSNEKDVYLRNQIRHHLIPVIREHFQDGISQMSASADQLKHNNQLLQELVELQRDRFCEQQPGGIEAWDMSEILKMDEGLNACFQFFKKYGLNYATVQQMVLSWSQRSGKMYQTATHQLLSHNGKMLVRAIPNFATQTIEIQLFEGQFEFQFGGFECTFRIQNDDKFMEGKMAVDLDKVKFPLTIRNRVEGDRFYPLGMKQGSKLLSDWMTDRKMNRWEKDETPVVIDAEGLVVMVGPDGISEKHKLDSQTRRILWFSAIRN